MWVVSLEFLDDIVSLGFNLDDRDMDGIYLFIMEGIIYVLFYQSYFSTTQHNISCFYRFHAFFIVSHQKNISATISLIMILIFVMDYDRLDFAACRLGISQYDLPIKFTQPRF